MLYKSVCLAIAMARYLSKDSYRGCNLNCVKACS